MFSWASSWCIAFPPPTISKLGQTLQGVKGLVQDVHVGNGDNVAVGKFMAQQGTAPTNPRLERTLQEVRGLYQEGHHEDVDDVEVGQFLVQRGAAPTISKLEQTLQEVKSLYQEVHQDYADYVEVASSLCSAFPPLPSRSLSILCRGQGLLPGGPSRECGRC